MKDQKAVTMLRIFVFLLASLGLMLATLSVRAEPGPPDAGGVWLGYLGSGLGLELRLAQEGQGLSGKGLLQQADPDNPIVLDLGGEINDEGRALLQLQGISVDEKDARLSLEVRFQGETAEARLVDVNGSGSQSLTLTRRFRAPNHQEVGPELPKLWNDQITPFATYRPTEVYMLDLAARVYFYDKEGYYVGKGLKNLHIRVELAGNLITEIAGSWRLEERDDSRGNIPALSSSLTFREGRVAAWNFLADSDSSHLILKTPDTLSVLGDLAFPRLRSGVVGASSFQKEFSTGDYRYIRLLNADGVAIPRATNITATLLRN